MEVATLSGVIQTAASVEEEEEEDENVDAGVMEALAAPLLLLLLLSLVEGMPLALLRQEDEDLMHLSVSLSVLLWAGLPQL